MASTDREREERKVEREHRRGKDPHHELNVPVGEPDPTEWPDPYDPRSDPRGPETVDTPADPAEPGSPEAADAPPRDQSTSDPPPPRSRDRARQEGVDR